MDAVGLNRAGHIDQVFVDHGNKGGVMPGGQVAESLFELLNVIPSVVGRKSNTGQQYFDVSVFQGSQHRVEVVTGLFRWKSAQAVVAAKLDNDHLGMQQQDSAQTGNGILGGGAAGALV